MNDQGQYYLFKGFLGCCLLICHIFVTLHDYTWTAILSLAFLTAMMVSKPFYLYWKNQGFTTRVDYHLYLLLALMFLNWTLWGHKAIMKLVMCLKP